MNYVSKTQQHSNYITCCQPIHNAKSLKRDIKTFSNYSQHVCTLSYLRTTPVGQLVIIYAYSVQMLSVCPASLIQMLDKQRQPLMNLAFVSIWDLHLFFVFNNLEIFDEVWCVLWILSFFHRLYLLGSDSFLIFPLATKLIIMNSFFMSYISMKLLLILKYDN